jgi:hypothetical protein
MLPAGAIVIAVIDSAPIASPMRMKSPTENEKNAIGISLPMFEGRQRRAQVQHGSR